MKRHVQVFSLLSLFLLPGTLILSGCSSVAVNENDPEALYQAAEEEIRNDRYQFALDRLRMVRNKFPYSRFSSLAQLRIADVYFLQETFVEAASAYQTFRDLHPKHEKTPYASYRVGESYFQETPGNVARDLSPAKRAHDAFKNFIRLYPSDPQTADAKSRLLQIEEKLAEKEIAIGKYYRRKDRVEASKARFQSVVRQYPQTQAAKEAEQLLKRLQGDN